MESRGFLIGPLIAIQLKVPFVPIRKPGKLPGNVQKVDFELEYGSVSVRILAAEIKLPTLYFITFYSNIMDFFVRISQNLILGIVNIGFVYKIQLIVKVL